MSDPANLPEPRPLTQARVAHLLRPRLPARPCAWCAGWWIPARRDALFCSASCKEMARQHRRAVEAEIGQAIAALERLRELLRKGKLTVGPVRRVS